MPRPPFLRGRKPLLLAALVIAIIGGAWWWQQPPRDPVFNGRRLSEVVFEVRDDGLGRMPTIERSQFDLRQFGPSAVPWLAYYVEHGKYPYESDRPRPFDRAPAWLRRWLPEKWGGFRGVSESDERALAATALSRFGPEAAPAIPALVASLRDAGETRLTWKAVEALHKIGPASWPAVDKALAQAPLKVRLCLVGQMSIRLGPDRPEAPDAEVAHIVDALLNACRDPDVGMRVEAANAFGTCHSLRPESPQFDRAIPELIRLLDDPEERVQGCATAILGSFANKAAAAVPRLIELLDSWDGSLRKNAALTLGLVDGAEKRSAVRLRAMSEDTSDSARESATQALRMLGVPPASATPAAEQTPGP